MGKPPWPCIWAMSSLIAKFWLAISLILTAMAAISLDSRALARIPPLIWWWWSLCRAAGAADGGGTFAFSLTLMGGVSSFELIFFSFDS